MRKIIFIILLLIISINYVFASSPAKLKNFSSSSVLKQGETVAIDTKVIYGNAVGYPYPYVEYSFNYDTDVFEFVSFKSNYDLSYDSNKMIVKGDNSFILDTHVSNEEEAEIIWTISFKVKEDAEVGEYFIADQNFSIIKNNNIDEILLLKMLILIFILLVVLFY